MKFASKVALTTTLTCAWLAGPAVAEEEVIEESAGSQYHDLKVTRIIGDLEHPWAVAFLPDESMLVTERPGRLHWLRNGEPVELHNLPDDLHVENQGGLLDVAVHPDYASNGWIYLTYSKGDEDGTATALIRAKIDDETMRLTDVEELFTQDRKSDPGRHYGSRILFLDDGTLLLSIGDRGVEPERAQDLEDHAGKMLRLTDDGNVPDDNPFRDRDDVHPEIYSYGHRNIQGMDIHPVTREIWAADHGPRGGDRLDRIEPGENYGWPVSTPGRDYGTEAQFGDSARERPDTAEPIREFLPTLAPSGLAIVNGGQFGNWENNILIGGLYVKQIRRVVLEDDEVVHEEEVLRDTIGRVRDVRIGPDNNIYAVSDESDGGLYRIEPAD
ncbi:PQQ-dependent sugar dehydrogenase [Phycisphaerales bacterium AB-hyl4]|uniref:PQQ-dependent sugar dehydrogenase n=1 Tax=Natronomicrosphaera hydrolytica TaxID=3242702 RepID=A0ABV4UAD9_9BACT